MKKIRIITFHHVTNNGAFLQAYTLCNSLQKSFDDFDVKIIDYRSPRLELYEILKIFKTYKKAPLYNLKRYLKFRTCVNRNIFLDRDFPNFRTYKGALNFFMKQNYDLLVVGSDVVWKISNSKLFPKFPNIYWLSDEIASKKVAYAVCSYKSDLRLVEKYNKSLSNSLNNFNLIGVRDDYTHNFVSSLGVNPEIPFLKMPDPTFLYEIKKTNVHKILIEEGIDLNKPILGILIYNRDNFSKSITDYFKSIGYQIIALSMYNPFADLNLGDRLDPFEWAEVFKYLSFCVTDRFHGTIFCLKNNTPFVSIESNSMDSIINSKIYLLLKDFEMLDCYTNITSENFMLDDFLNKCLALSNSWNDEYGYNIECKLEDMKHKSHEFINKIKMVESS
ncbi:hypothetical protein LI82_11890 [Methanococcoides methylutens]|uniref:Polysaccharide pyruvyl transferase domain-containing protein n=1 Tax=Methanococcoides methylutens TaxID=2226 RepID=A0A099T2D7_METMT|nr:polysaccharide pyruvyl transferase family protein [Methanococcoides methylutens]KGK98396.1 hypothetical protein LI82_11890 [Methanococcoides methylutens]